MRWLIKAGANGAPALRHWHMDTATRDRIDCRRASMRRQARFMSFALELKRDSPIRAKSVRLAVGPVVSPDKLLSRASQSKVRA